MNIKQLFFLQLLVFSMLSFCTNDHNKTDLIDEQIQSTTENSRNIVYDGAYAGVLISGTISTATGIQSIYQSPSSEMILLAGLGIAVITAVGALAGATMAIALFIHTKKIKSS